MYLDLDGCRSLPHTFYLMMLTNLTDSQTVEGYLNIVPVYAIKYSLITSKDTLLYSIFLQSHYRVVFDLYDTALCAAPVLPSRPESEIRVIRVLK